MGWLFSCRAESASMSFLFVLPRDDHLSSVFFEMRYLKSQRFHFGEERNSITCLRIPLPLLHLRKTDDNDSRPLWLPAVCVRLDRSILFLITSLATSRTDTSDTCTDAEQGEASGFRNGSNISLAENQVVDSRVRTDSRVKTSKNFEA